MDQQLTPDEKLESMRFTGERYEVDVPWKHDRPHLQSNWTPISQLEFNNVFWSSIGEMVVESFYEVYEEGEMSNSQRHGVIEKNR